MASDGPTADDDQRNKRNGLAENESLKSLGKQLNDPALRSSARILILISLSINNKLSFVELLELTGLGKGSLENHVEKLAASGYVTTRNIKTFGGMRMIIEISDKGKETCKTLLKQIGEFGNGE